MAQGSPNTLADLKRTHPLHGKLLKTWQFLQASYEGLRALLEWGVLERHERESQENYERRLKEAYGFGYSQSIVDLFNFYLFKQPPKRDLGNLADDEFWNMFFEDCNLQGDDLDVWLINQQRSASISGHVGILVDKPTRQVETLAEQKEAEIYPYVSSFLPNNIMDWEFELDENQRPNLEFVKLLTDDGRLLLWWRDRFEIYKSPDVAATEDKSYKPILIDSGDNPLEEVPFLWLFNLKSFLPMIGKSDIAEVAYIDSSIIRNLSQSEEIVNYAAFPMMRKPLQEAMGADQTDETGTTAVLEFDPERPETKPDWLESKVKEPIDAILVLIAKKVEEIYRASNAGGMAATTPSTVAKSGVALKTEFQLLNSKLVSKGSNLLKAEKRIVNLWLAWQGQEELAEDTKIERAQTYEIEDLATDLENALTSKAIVKSHQFAIAIQKHVARLMLPSFTDDQMKPIDDEIEAQPEVVQGVAETTEDDLQLALDAKSIAPSEAVKGEL